jgi:hypothetical protein
MSVRAQWFSADLAVDTADPFAEEDPVTVGVPVDLDVAQGRRLVELLEREETLASGGLTCKLKDRVDTCCHACPKQGVKGQLCEVGLAQERLIGEMAVRSYGA